MELTQYVAIKYGLVVAVLIVIGKTLKTSKLIDDRYIPILLVVLGTIIAGIGSYVGAINDSLYNAIMKGAIAGASAVGVHQAYKQSTK